MVRLGRCRRGALRREGHRLGAMDRLVFAAVMLAYRPGLWYPEDIEYALLNVMLATLNGVFHYRLLTNRPVTWRWMVGLSAMDIALITANIAVSGRFDNYIFLTYYPALGAIAVIFTSFRVNMA